MEETAPEQPHKFHIKHFIYLLKIMIQYTKKKKKNKKKFSKQ